MRSIQNLPWAARLGEGRFTVNKIFFGKVKTGHFPRKNEENLFLARMETGRETRVGHRMSDGVGQEMSEGKNGDCERLPWIARY